MPHNDDTAFDSNLVVSLIGDGASLCFALVALLLCALGILMLLTPRRSIQRTISKQGTTILGREADLKRVRQQPHHERSLLKRYRRSWTEVKRADTDEAAVHGSG
eukprot:scaffold156745_cov32-Tisochrysis_lutea.AAC.3